MNFAEVIALINAFFDPKNVNWESWRKWFNSDKRKPELSRTGKEITCDLRVGQ
jgi:hypothetical protein